MIPTLADFVVTERPEAPGVCVPMVVRADMNAPVVSYDDTIMLDGLLEYAVFRRAEALLGRNALPELSGASEPLTWRLPLAAVDAGDVWVWCASAAQWPEQVARSTHHIRRRPPVEYLQRHTDVGRVTINLAGTKAKNAPTPQTFARELTWYAVGDPDLVRDLLVDISNVGQLRNHGRGEVIRWHVEPHDDTDAWRRRPMPGEGGDSIAYRAPYWHRRRRTTGAALWG